MDVVRAILMSEAEYEQLAKTIAQALEGDSNDAEHDALVEVADLLGVDWTSPYDESEEP